jgi:hypothetical protein
VVPCPILPSIVPFFHPFIRRSCYARSISTALLTISRWNTVSNCEVCISGSAREPTPRPLSVFYLYLIMLVLSGWWVVLGLVSFSKLVFFSRVQWQLLSAFRCSGRVSSRIPRTYFNQTTLGPPELRPLLGHAASQNIPEIPPGFPCSPLLLANFNLT